MRDDWTPKPADRFIRHPRQDEISPVRLTIRTRKGQSSYLTSPLLILYVFAVIIAAGTLLLLLPITNNEGRVTPFLVAFFTATSAATLTGLVVQETATYWTRVGQSIILALTFIGGLGFMTIATFLLLLIGQRVALTDRFLVSESVAVNQLSGLLKLALAITLVTSIIQVVGFAAMLARFLYIYQTAEAVWQAAFHSVSAFNNAGFTTLREPGDLISLKTDKILLSIVSILVFLGSIGYLVIIDVVRFRRFSRFALNTKLVLIFSVLMAVIGAFGILALEHQNPQTLGSLSLLEKIWESLYQSVIGRTAGFTIVDVGSFNKQTNFLFTALMFIGGASASAAGGIKINTFAVILIATASTVRGRNYPAVFDREITQGQVWRAMVIGVLASVFVFLMVWVLVISEEGFTVIELLFETVSAFGTTGLSTGITPKLSIPGKLVIIVLMFVGRIGPLTIALFMASRTERDVYRYAQERVTIG